MARLAAYFARGCLIIVPALLTVYILASLVTRLDEAFGVKYPGLGLLLTLLITTATGLLLSNVVGKKIYRFVDLLFARAPVVKLLYTSIKDLVSAFVGGKGNFGSPVSVKLNGETGPRVFGFMTRKSLPAVSMEEHVAVYVPLAYALGGQVLIVPHSLVEPLNVSPTDLLTFSMSGGASGLGAAIEPKDSLLPRPAP